MFITYCLLMVVAIVGFISYKYVQKSNVLFSASCLAYVCALAILVVLLRGTDPLDRRYDFYTFLFVLTGCMLIPAVLSLIGKKTITSVRNKYNNYTPPKGAILEVFQCNGCVAHIHEWVFTGIVVGHETNRNGVDVVRVKVIKRGNQDYRDVDFGIEDVPLVSVQKLTDNLFMEFK